MLCVQKRISREYVSDCVRMPDKCDRPIGNYVSDRLLYVWQITNTNTHTGTAGNCVFINIKNPCLLSLVSLVLFFWPLSFLYPIEFQVISKFLKQLTVHLLSFQSNTLVLAWYMLAPNDCMGMVVTIRKYMKLEIGKHTIYAEIHGIVSDIHISGTSTWHTSSILKQNIHVLRPHTCTYMGSMAATWHKHPTLP